MNVTAPIRTAAVGAFIALAVLSLVPITLRPHVFQSGNLEHFVAYCGTAGLFGLGFRRPGWAIWVGGLVIAAGLFEIAQIWIPGRNAAFDNFLASSLGTLVGGVMSLLARRALALVTFPGGAAD